MAGSVGICSPRVRTASDRLTRDDLENFQVEMESYILSYKDRIDALWQFHSYNGEPQDGEDATTDKMAPHIPHLLRNAELWGIMLKYFQVAR